MTYLLWLLGTWAMICLTFGWLLNPHLRWYKIEIVPAVVLFFMPFAALFDFVLGLFGLEFPNPDRRRARKQEAEDE